jgi:hypothetical protein
MMACMQHPAATLPLCTSNNVVSPISPLVFILKSVVLVRRQGLYPTVIFPQYPMVDVISWHTKEAEEEITYPRKL